MEQDPALTGWGLQAQDRPRAARSATACRVYDACAKGKQRWVGTYDSVQEAVAAKSAGPRASMTQQAVAVARRLPTAGQHRPQGAPGHARPRRTRPGGATLRADPASRSLKPTSHDAGAPTRPLACPLRRWSAGYSRLISTDPSAVRSSFTSSSAIMSPRRIRRGGLQLRLGVTTDRTPVSAKLVLDVERARESGRGCSRSRACRASASTALQR